MSVYEYSAKDIDGQEVPLSNFEGKVLLIVNTASKCGFTPQYEGLQSLYEKYSDSGLEVLGFPCNQFGSQEPGDEGAIKEFCSTRYNVTFPMFSKVEVNGQHAHPLYKYLTSGAPGILGTESIKWNFTKFLVDRNGNVVKRFAPNDSPASIESDVEQALRA